MITNLSIKGRVEIYTFNDQNEKILLREINNLVVYNGREFILPAVLKVDNEDIMPRSNWGLYYWSFGSGGVYNPSDPFTRKLPYPNDNDLEIPITTLDPTIPGTTPSRRYRRHAAVNYLTDDLNGNRYLIVSLTCTLAKNECVDLHISEVGLYLSDSPNPGNASSFVLFARTTFESIKKSSYHPIIFNWYLYV